jgi:uncharacterized protein GlcG (DUF336 family)
MLLETGTGQYSQILEVFMRGKQWALMGVVLLGPLALGGPAKAELPVEKALPLALAQEAAAEACAVCERNGYKVAATVVDRAGVVKAVLRADGAATHTISTSKRKAYTSVSFRAPTAAAMERAAASPGAANLRDIKGVILLAGGQPISAGGELVGAIGVAGAPGGDKDDVCAQAALERIKDRLR